MNLSGSGMTSQRARDRMLERLIDSGIKSLEVLEVVRSTPRHIFLEEAFAHRAYDDSSLPIGHGQTISQPYTVARMTEALVRTGPIDRVLEVGTGCGYQTAIISRLAREVCSVERIKPLLIKARRNLAQLGVHNVRMKHCDGSVGWPTRAPFDAILAAAAPDAVPDALLHQLAEGGRLVIPVGNDDGQELHLVTRRGDEFDTTKLGAVKFVPFLAGQVNA